MKNYTITIMLLLQLFVVAVNAQDVISGSKDMWPSSVTSRENIPTFRLNQIQLSDENGKTAVIRNINLIQAESDELNMKHYRYQQHLNNIPVEGAIWVVHTSSGKVNRQNGKLVKVFPSQLSSKAGITEKDALMNAVKYIGAVTYKWQIASEENFIRSEKGDPNATFYPKAELVYYSGEYDVVPANLRLAYKFDIYAHEPLSRCYVFVDAVTGDILGRRELIHETNAVGTAVTAYSGNQTITSDFTGTNYRLRETARGAGNGEINTYNLQNGINYGTAVDFTDADNFWNNVNAAKDEYATDAHWATEMTYDYYYSMHNRNSIDNLGFPLNSYVHYSTNYFNAFWDGSRMTYGDGNATNGNRPLTSLDVCGHEITHGVTERTSGLVYSYESGALNEAFSDIFGTAIEKFARPGNYDWLVGGDFYSIRSMSNPNLFSDPDTYYGTFWYTGINDYGGVHTNSGVLNFWFYLLTTGGTGTNDHAFNYAVSGIGIDDAAKIAYRLNTFYLVPTSNYNDARTFSIQAAEDLFGIGSNQVIQTANAWDAVGVYAQSCTPLTNLFASAITQTTAVLNWDVMPGAVFYVVEKKLASSATWNVEGVATTNSFALNSLSASTVYDWRVRSSCNTGYSQSQFTSANPACNPPTSLNVSVNGNSATLEWDAMPYGINYHIYFKPAIDSLWIDSGFVSGVNYTLTGLNSNTEYNWKVETNCGFGTSDAAIGSFITNTESCGTPSALITTFSGLTSTFDWSPVSGATAYRLQMKWPYGSWTNPGFDTTVVGDSFVFTGFGSGMTLDWRVRAFCPENISLWASSTFTTPCPAPTTLTVGSIGNTSASLSWNPSGANTFYGYRVYYKLATSSTWTYAGYAMATSFALGGLQPGKLYDVRVSQECLDINSSDVISNFTTLCTTIPGAVSSSDVKSNAAKISWNPVSGVVSYSLQYKRTSVSTWTTVNGITATSYVITGLNAATAYQYKVAAVCTYGSTAYSTIGTFTTYCTSTGLNSQEWIDLFSIGTINRTSGADAGGYIHTGLSTNLVIGSVNSGLISAGFSGATRTEIFAIYIDFNRNGSYADAGERVTGPVTFTSTGNISFTVTIPGTATAGQTSMRVVMARNGSGTVGPCNTGRRGEIEDYFVNITVGSALVRQEADPAKFSPSEISTFTVTPNPSDGMYHIESVDETKISEYVVYDIAGSLITNGFAGDVQEMYIDISRHKSGMYFLKLTDRNNNISVMKLIKE